MHAAAQLMCHCAAQNSRGKWSQPCRRTTAVAFASDQEAGQAGI